MSELRHWNFNSIELIYSFLKHVIRTRTHINEANADIETQLVIVQAKISKCSK